MALDLEQVRQILQRIRQGDIDAYAELVVAYQSDVWKVAAAIPGGMREIEELVQQTFVQAYQQLETFDSRRDFGPWIKEIARNQTRMELRRAMRESSRLNRYYEEWMRDLNAEESGNTEALEEALRTCRQELSEHLDQIVAQRYEQALSFEDIARQIGRSVAATRQLISRARVALRDCVARKGGFA